MEFKSKILRADQWMDVMTLMRDSFNKYEPLALISHVSVDEATEFCIPETKAYASSGISLALYDAEDNIIGFRLSRIELRDSAKIDYGGDMELSPQLKVMKKVFLHLVYDVNIFDIEPSVNKVLVFGMVTIDPKYRGRGFANRLIKESEILGKQEGCERAVVQATNKITQSIFKKLGYTTKYVLDYEKFQIDGIQVLDLSAGNGMTEAWVMTKDL